jgi:hypothetical protein
LLAATWSGHEAAILSGALDADSATAVPSLRHIVGAGAAVLALITGGRAAPISVQTVAALAAFSAALGASHVAPNDAAGWWYAGGAALLALAAAANAGRAPALPGAAPRAARVVLVTGLVALGTALFAARGTEVAGLRLSSGSRMDTLGLTITHQGISRYETDGGHIVAVALAFGTADGGRGRVERVTVAEQRERVNARGEVLGAVELRPAVSWRGTARVFAWLDKAAADGTANLTVRREALAFAWPAAVLLLVTGVLLGGRSARSFAVACPRCGPRAEPAPRFCSACGRAVA